MRIYPPNLQLRRTVVVAASSLGVVIATNAVATAQPAVPATSSPEPLGVTVRFSQGAASAAKAGLSDSVAVDALGLSPETRGADPVSAVRTLAGRGREVVVDVRSAAEGWARGVTYIEAPADEHAAPQGWLFIARYDNGRWQTALEGERQFAGFAAASPLVSAAERRTLQAYATKRAITSNTTGTLAATGLLLPWMPDYYMTMAGGPHAWDAGSGPWSSMDFSAGNASGIVRSSGSGTATSMCGSGGGWTRVIHSNGFSTDYYHMINTTYYNGTAVGRSAYLGTIGVDLCAGGSANGPHVHWALRTYDSNLNGQYTSLNGRGIGGWTFYTGSAQYGGYATRNGVTAYPGDAIYNRVS